MSVNVSALQVGWDDTARHLITEEWFGVDVALRRYVAHIMDRLAPGMAPPPVDHVDVLSNALWGTAAGVLTPVSGDPLGVSEIRVGAGGATVAGGLTVGGEVSVAGDLTFTGASSDIGTDVGLRAAGGRPRDVFVDRDLHLGRGIVGDLHIQSPPGTSNAWIVASTGSMTLNAIDVNTAQVNGNLVVDGSIQSKLGAVMLGIDTSHGWISWDNSTNAFHFTVGGLSRADISAIGDLHANGKIFAGPVHALGQTGDISTDRGGGSGTLYFGGGPSVYLHYSGPTDAGSFSLVGGALTLSQVQASVAVSAPSVNGTTINVAGNIHLVAGHGLYFEGSHVVRTWWDGTWMRFSHNVHHDAGCYTSGQHHIVGRLITNNSDWGWSNNLGGNCHVGSDLQTGARVTAGEHLYTTSGGGGAVVTMWGVHGWDHGPAQGNYQLLLNVYSYGAALANSWNLHSARRLKDHIQPISNALAIVTNPSLHGVEYDRAEYTPTEYERTHGMAVKHEYGYVAEDWEQVQPSLVGHDSDGSVMGLDYDRIGAVTFEAVKQLAERVETLTARVAELEAKQP